MLGACDEVRYNGVYFPGLWLGYIRYGAAVTARVSPQRHDYWIHLPLHGSMEFSQRGKRVQCDRRRGMISSPTDVNVVRSDSGAARLSIAIRGDALERHLSLLLDDAPQAPLAFEAELGLEDGYGRSLAVMLRCAAAELARDDCAPRERGAVALGLRARRPLLERVSPALRRVAFAHAGEGEKRITSVFRSRMTAAGALTDVRPPAETCAAKIEREVR